MDIVQYLHGLVSNSLGVLEDSSQADLLKQYYALSIVRLTNQSFNISNDSHHDTTSLWGKVFPSLVQRLSRSFHLPQDKTQALLQSATPLMLTELGNLSGETVSFIRQNLADSNAHLPAWAAQFVSLPSSPQQPVTQIPQNTDNDTNNNPYANQEPSLANTQTISIKPKKTSSPAPVLLGVLLGALIVGGGVGIWHFTKSKTEANNVAQTNANTTQTTTNPPRLSITAGENNTLYACYAEVGSQELQSQLLQILQKNFGSVNCVMQINHHFGTSLAGLERLDSIIAMIKSETFTSIDIIGNQILVNSPKPDIITRMVNDIKLLAPQFDVLAMPALDRTNLINQSIERATTALNSLNNPISAHDLSWAMSLQILDFNGTSQLPAQNQAPLTLAAQKLKENPDIKLIIATHTDASNPDRMANIALSEAQANAVRDFLISQGVADTQLVAKGVGDTFSIADNVTEVGKFKNRRTEFLVFDEGILSALSANTTATIQPMAPAMPIQPITPMPPPVTQAMPVQGMPSGVVAPEPVYPAQPLPPNYPNEAKPMPPPTPAPVPAAPTVRELPKGTPIPKEVLELSQTSIGSEDTVGTSYEVEDHQYQPE